MDKDELILTAVKTLPPAALADPRSAQVNITRQALKISAALSEHSLASRTLDSKRISATVLSVEREEATSRFIVKFKADKQRPGFDEIESGRTDRTDSWMGRIVEDMWSGLEGHHVRLYKRLEPTGNPSKPNVKVLVYVERLD